jgi:NAD(P)-dependent dehydrogenase (short-subunit alcohol dehydrogenase family)
MLIAGGQLDRAALAEDVVIVTGAGGGIGFEAARSLLYLGARVVVAEINATSGQSLAPGKQMWRASATKSLARRRRSQHVADQAAARSAINTGRSVT